MGIVDRTGCPDDEEMSHKLDGPFDPIDKPMREYTADAIRHQTEVSTTRWVSSAVTLVALGLLGAITYSCNNTSASACERAGASWIPVETANGAHEMSCVTKDALPSVMAKRVAAEQPKPEPAPVVLSDTPQAKITQQGATVSITVPQSEH